MFEIINSSVISGVRIVRLLHFEDERGKFREIFRKEWFPERSWDVLQSNLSMSRAGVLRGLHYHFNQVDYWYVTSGRLRAGLVDLRPSSPTFRATKTVDMGEGNDVGLFIPVGVAHGFATHTTAKLIYFVDNYYDGNDEYGVRWDDPALGIDWGIVEPVVSARDKSNPLFNAILPEDMPG